MKKIYSIIGLFALAFTVNAQTHRTASKASRPVTGHPVAGVTTATTAVVAAPSLNTCTLTMYTSDQIGYIAGSNDLGDKEKAQRFDLTTFGLTTPGSVSLAGAFVGYLTDGGAGSSVTAKIYDEVSGMPGNLLGTSVSVPLASITSGTVNVFPFAAPVALTGNVFYVSIDISGLDLVAGDTIAIVQTEDGCTDNGTTQSWEKWSDDTWVSLEDANGWEFVSTDLAILAQVSAEIVTGVKNTTINTTVNVTPNPSNGVFNVAVKSSALENVNVTVTNAIGQSVFNKNYNLSSENISFDLSSQTNGVYFVTITSGNDKTVKKVVVNK